MNSTTSLKALKHVLKRDPASVALLKSYCDRFGVEFCFEDARQTILWGSRDGLDLSRPFEFDDHHLGTFYYSAEGALSILELLKVLFQKEWEKKKIGKEVLGLYREINMIYDLSELISEKIDAESIARVALEEASQIINTTHGLFLMYDPDHDMVIQVARLGDNPKSEAFIDQQKEVLKDLIRKGISAIVPAERVAANPALRHLKTVMYAPLKVKHRTLGMVILGHEDEVEYTAAELKLLTTISLQSATAIESAHLYQKGLKEVQDREEAIRKIHDASQKFVPSEFIKSLGKAKITEVSLGDLVEREVTVVFVDIRGFTTISEDLDPRDNFLFVMQEYNKERALKNRLPVRIGVGMQNGKLIMGITGDSERLDAAIISDTVNTAARIEGLSKHYGTSILLTEECRKNLTNPEDFDFRYLGRVQLKGKTNPIDLYECFNGDEFELQNHKRSTLKTFDDAMALYFNKEFAMAAVSFQQIFKMNPDDHTAKLFLNRSAQLITQELGENWKGVETMTTK
ncbi:MAG: adenylate/guanylate cyclase domain-containing protein [Robiginitalea sp.]